ncbi:hypothetical protein LOTGIDRAFT_168825 [Lottia gigantea]|uniref:Endoglucanase n=1 Tax=Lottia gigantea TaxID=225164 RepID=V3ZPH9_LOTGI|nr:hypothetical protein LOTGIDRAFT_168825 [Lottia gigantea]ESO84375.1 hypothetical protein LOTGIDRAFT_168825 [Lottia gigantea]
MKTLLILLGLLSIQLISAQLSPSCFTRYNYGDVVQKSILFYYAQRSGKLPAYNPVPWRGDSAVNDQGDNGEDLSGGWYDAGDLVKFNMPASSAVRVLLSGIVRWKDAYQALGQLDLALDSVKWELDYFLKCWIADKEIYYYQVGDADIDHKFWGRPEDMSMPRPAFYLTKDKPGSDVAGGTAATFAAGAIAFNITDAVYSQKLLKAAESLYKFAVTYKGKYSQTHSDTGTYYESSAYEDELCVAAAWLYKATGNTFYLTEAKLYHSSATPNRLDWDNSLPSCQLMLYELTKNDLYKGEIQKFLTVWKPGGNTTYTPCGLGIFDRWGTARHAADNSYAALWAAELGIDPLENRNWALSQINYILGDNNYKMSYVIGFGNKYPLKPHHRPSSCPDLNMYCGWDAFYSTAPNPHRLEGALVGGPNKTDGWDDDRGDYVRNEVALDYNAGLQSACAGLVHICSTGELPPNPTPKC